MPFLGAAFAIFMFSLIFSWVTWRVALWAPRVGILLLPAMAALLGGAVAMLSSTSLDSFLVVLLFAVLGGLGSVVCHVYNMIYTRPE